MISRKFVPVIVAFQVTLRMTLRDFWYGKDRFRISDSEMLPIKEQTDNYTSWTPTLVLQTQWLLCLIYKEFLVKTKV